MQITTDSFVNSTDFVNSTTNYTAQDEDNSEPYWLIGIGVFVFFCLIGSCGKGGARKTGNNHRPSAPPQNTQPPPSTQIPTVSEFTQITPPADESTSTTPPVDESTSSTPPVEESTSTPAPAAIYIQGMEGEDTYQNDSVFPTAPPPSYDSIMSHHSMPPPSYDDTVVK